MEGRGRGACECPGVPPIFVALLPRPTSEGQNLGPRSRAFEDISLWHRSRSPTRIQRSERCQTPHRRGTAREADPEPPAMHARIRNSLRTLLFQAPRNTCKDKGSRSETRGSASPVLPPRKRAKGCDFPLHRIDALQQKKTSAQSLHYLYTDSPTFMLQIVCEYMHALSGCVLNPGSTNSPWFLTTKRIYMKTNQKVKQRTHRQPHTHTHFCRPVILT